MSEEDSPSTCSLPHHVRWSEECYTLSDFSNEDRLPRLIKLNDNQAQTLLLGLQPHRHEPFLLYKLLNREVVLARSIYKEKESGKFFEVGEILQIPEDFEGLFELVPLSFGRGAYYKSISDIVDVMPARIFTRTPLTALRIVDGDGGKPNYLERKVPAGTVLKVKNVFTAKWRTIANTGFFKTKTTEFVTSEEKYLKCVDSQQTEILISFSQRGKFNSLYEKGVRRPKVLYKIHELREEFPFPLKIRLIYGRPPVDRCIFTDLLVLHETKLEESVVASTVGNRRNALIEIPLDSSVLVQIPRGDESENEEVKRADRFCRENVLGFSSMIKLSPCFQNLARVELLPDLAKPAEGTADGLKNPDLLEGLVLEDGRELGSESSTEHHSYYGEIGDSEQHIYTKYKLNSSEPQLTPKTGEAELIELKEIDTRRKSFVC